MNFFRRNLIATAPAALGLLLFAGGASASTITGSTSTYGNIAAFTSSSSTSAGQFNQTALDAAIQAACPAGNVCSGSTLTEIDVILTANLTASVGLSNSNGVTSYAPALGSLNGNFNAPTSGIAIQEMSYVDISDPINSGFVEDAPTFSVATTTEFKSATCAGTAAPTSGSYHNCLAVPTTGSSYSGSGTDTETSSYTSGSGGLAGALSTYVGSGVVHFTLSSYGNTNDNLPSGVTLSTNSSSITALSSGLEITYDYSYTETTTPEPTTMALVGGALLAIGLIRKKRLS